MLKIYCFGNKFIENDEVAKELGQRIRSFQNFEFVIAESPSEILNAEPEVWILDVVKGINKTTLIKNSRDLLQKMAVIN